MRIRHFIALAAVLAVMPAARAEDPPPSIVLKMKSIEGILKDVRYVGSLAGEDAQEMLKQLDEVLKGYQNDQGLGGLDVKRPIGLYGNLTPGVQDSPVVLLLPLHDEKAFLELLEKFEIKAKKDDDGIFTIDSVPMIPLPVTIYFRIENKYVYATVNDKANIAKDKLLAPEKIFAADDAFMSLKVRIADLPDIVKQIVLSQAEGALAQAKEKSDPNEPEAITKLKEKGVDYINNQLKAILTEGEELNVRFNVQSDKDDLITDITFKAKSGSGLAKSMAAAGSVKSLFAGLATKEDAIFANGAIIFNEELKGLIGPAVDQFVMMILEQEKDAVKQALVKAALEKIVPTLKAGDIDGGVSVRGPNKDGQYTIVGGVKVKEGKGLEAFVKDFIKNAPEKDREKITIDADSVGDTKIHKIVIDDMDPEMSKILGTPAVYLAVRDDALLVGLGPDGLAAVKAAATVTPQTINSLKINVSAARVAGMVKDDENVAKVAKEIFGANPSGSDMVSITAEMTDTLKLRIHIKGKVVGFAVKSAEGGANAPAK